MKKINRLMMVAVGGLWACTGMVFLYTYKISNEILKSSLHQKAMEILNRNEGAIYYLGQPIKELKASLLDPGPNHNNRKHIRVHVLGPKSKGQLFYSAEPDQNQIMQIDTIQLQIGNDDSKRLIIKKSSHENSSE